MFALLACCGVGTGVAKADFGFEEFGVSLTGSDGNFSRQAGAHADLTTWLAFNHHGDRIDGNARDVRVALPLGMVGNARNFATCTFTELLRFAGECPTASQVGSVVVETNIPSNTQFINAGLYNMPRPANRPALFAFNYSSSVVTLVPEVSSGDYGVSTGSAVITQALPTFTAKITVWGVPADPVHDPERIDDTGTILGVPSPAPPAVLLSNPTSCPGQPSVVTAEADSWENPGIFVSSSVDKDLEDTPLLFKGCENLPFAPTAYIAPTSAVAGAPTGLHVHIEVPQNESPYGVSTADVRRTTVSFPPGFAINPTSVSGQAACSMAEIGIGKNEAPSCPADSSIGAVRIKTPLLEEELEGQLFLAQQRNNPFGSNFALYLAVEGPGFWIKLPGKIEANSGSGQITASFADQPQLPYETVDLELRPGPRAPLVAPPTCGGYAVSVEMESWASSAATHLSAPTSFVEGCPGGEFHPKLEAGTINPVGGSYSGFLLRIGRQDGESNLSRIDATLPPGLLAKLAGVPLCGDAQAGSGNCPAASQVGTTTIGVGAGSNPLYVPEAGKGPTAVYLAGPYKGAPYSLVVKVPAQAGPFDLGTVVVRNALRIDPTTTQVTAESDPLPQILEGIPISYRDVRVEIKRPEFTVNPTNCSQFAVTSLLTSSSGQTATPRAPFAAANCERLGFKPTLALQMKGQTKRAGNPALTATLKAPKGQANIANTTVILPKTVFIDQRHVSNPCTRVQFNANACPAKSVLGTAVAYSPLLDEPLEGPVYFRSNGGERQLPDLVADLNGQIHVELVGFIDSKKVGKETSLVRTRFASVPDAPVSKFVLRLKGGNRSLIQNSANLCKVQPKAEVKMTGQNGKTNDFDQKIAVACGKSKPKKAKH
jgi:hypothetical protein